MKPVLAALAAIFVSSMPVAAHAAEEVKSAEAERYRAAMQGARWTGPLLASTAETLPHGHFYTEPYFFDSISGGIDYPGTSGFYQYGLTDNYTVGFQPFFSLGTQKFNRELAIGDTKIVSQVRVSHFTAAHRVPSVAIVMNLVVPTGKSDHLAALKEGHGSGAFAPEVGVNVQQYFLLGNGRLLRARINILERIPLREQVSGRSVFGTDADFRGHARAGAKTSVILGAEYSLTKEWVLAFDIERDQWGKTRITGRNGAGPRISEVAPRSWDIGFAPAVEYNWSDRAGIIAGVWIVPKGHNAPSSVTPAIAIQRFW